MEPPVEHAEPGVPATLTSLEELHFPDAAKARGQEFRSTTDTGAKFKVTGGSVTSRDLAAVFWERQDTLKSLELILCNVNSVPKLPTTLENLYIHECAELRHLGEFNSNLKKIWISDCPNLTQLPELPVNLEFLGIRNCGLTNLPELTGRPRLETLAVCDNTRLTTVANLPEYVKSLYLYNLPNLRGTLVIPRGPSNIRIHGLSQVLTNNLHLIIE